MYQVCRNEPQIGNCKVQRIQFSNNHWGGGVHLTWFGLGVHTYMTGETLSRQVYRLRKRLHVKLCNPGGLLYKSDGAARQKIQIKPLRETNVGVAQA